MVKYRVVLTRKEILDYRDTEANTEKEAIDKVYDTFEKFDLDDYDDIEVEVLTEENDKEE